METKEAIRIKMNIFIPNQILILNSIFKEKGFELYVVGGAVRDAITGKNPKDYDLATNAIPDAVISLLKYKYKVLEVGKAFGVVNVIIDGHEFEIATFRADSDSSDGRRPDSVV